MKKVFMIHGFNSCPNSSWLPWLMGELKTKDIYACSLSMPNPGTPIRLEWVNEIARHISLHPSDEIYLVGHSLGSAAILNYLQSESSKIIKGVVLVSGRCQKSNNPLTEGFYESFDFVKIKASAEQFAIIHGDNDEIVSVENAYILRDHLGVEPLIIKDGGHLTGSQGWKKLPQCLEKLEEMMNMK